MTLEEQWGHMQVIVNKAINKYPWVADIPISADPYLLAQSARGRKYRKRKEKLQK